MIPKSGRHRYLVVVPMAVALFSSLSCAAPEAPQWLEQKKSEILQTPAASPPRSIYRIDHAGKTYYVISAACCDIPSEVLSEKGEHICFAGGGISTDLHKCPDISMAPKDLHEIWTDSRPTPSR